MTMIVNGYEIKPGADLFMANLMGADLRALDLSFAYLIRANLMEAKLTWTNLEKANLMGAILWGVDLYGANIMGANFSGADLRFCNFINAKFGPDGPNPRNFVGCVGWAAATFDDRVKDKLMAGIEALKAEGVTQ